MISGPSSYPPTVAEFLAHWALVNTTLGAGNELKLVDGELRSNVVTELEALEALRDEVTDFGVNMAEARSNISLLVVELQGRVVEFNRRVRADLPGTSMERIVPVAFAIGDAEGTVRSVLRVMSRVWGKINAMGNPPTGLTLPLSLMGGMTLTAFDAKREELRLAYRAYGNAVVDLREARERRNDKQDYLYELLKEYRMKVPTRFPAEHALVESLPRLTPAEGHTPDAVMAQGEWVAASLEARVTWSESAEATLVRYEVRAVPGDDYDPQDEQVVATVPAGGAREVLTNFALATPGVTAGFKVVVVLATGNERASTAVYVTRPV